MASLTLIAATMTFCGLVLLENASSSPLVPQTLRLVSGLRVAKRLSNGPTLVTREDQRRTSDRLNPAIADVTPRTQRRIPRPTQVSNQESASVRGASVSSGSSRRHDRLSPCERRPKNRTLQIDGCLPIRVDVGGCYGACPSREQPTHNAQMRADGVIAFPNTARCRCCRAFSYETKKVTVRCNAPGGDGLEDYVVSVAVVKSCECRKCERQQ